MSYYLRRPGPPLADYVDHCWQFSGHRVAMPGGLLFADGGADLMWNLSAPMRLVRDGATTTWAQSWVSGQRTRPVAIELDVTCFTMVGVRFRPGGLPALIGAPARGLADEVVDLREFWRGAAREVHDRLVDADGVGARFDVIEQALLRQLAPRRGPRRGLTQLLGHIAAEPSRFSVARAERELDVSNRHLGRLFGAHVGMTPKLFQRVARFRGLMRALVGVERPDWAALAASTGYTDQPHLCRDFREFTGMTPSRFRLLVPQPSYMPWADTRWLPPADPR